MTPRPHPNPDIRPALGEVADTLQQIATTVQETGEIIARSSATLDRIEAGVRDATSKLLQVAMLHWLQGEATDAFTGAAWGPDISDLSTPHGIRRRVPPQIRAVMADAFRQLAQDNTASYTTEDPLLDGRYVATNKLTSEQRTLHGETLHNGEQELVIWLGMISTPLDTSPSVKPDERT